MKETAKFNSQDVHRLREEQGHLSRYRLAEKLYRLIQAV